MKKRGAQILILILFHSFHSALWSFGQINGTVADAQSGQPLPGANIQVLGTVLGSSADAKGHFQIRNIYPGKYQIRVSMISYRAKTVDIKIGENQTTEVHVELQETPIEFDPIVVLGGKVQQRLDQANASLSVVSAREIENKSATDLIVALESAPGVNFIGNQINIRGSTGYTFGAGNKVLLLLDGVPVYASDTGEFNWDMLPPLDIQQIEVLKGAGSTLWGTSALGGVVNIITRPPSRDGQLRFAYTGGKYGYPQYKAWEWTDHDKLYYTRGDVSYSQQMGKLGMRVSAGRFTSTGYTEVGDFNKYNVTGKFDVHFQNGLKWTSYAAFSYIHRGFFIQWKGPNDPYEVDETNLDNYGRTNQLNLYTKLAIPLSPGFGLRFRVSMVRSILGDQFGETSDINPSLGQGAEIQADWIPHTSHTITGGINFQHDAGSAKYFGNHIGYFLGPYIQDEWSVLKNLRATLGLRYDRYQLIDGLREDLFSPRFGVNWQPWPTTSLRGSVGSGFRAATIVERFLEVSVMNLKVQSNPDLQAESCWAYDAGLRHHFTENWNLDLSVFRNDYKNLIEAHLDLFRGLIQFRNVGRARVQGLEITTKWSQPLFITGLRFTPSVDVSLTAMDHRDLKWNAPLTYRPNTLATLKTAFQVGIINLQVDYRYASRIEAVKIYPINQRVPMKFWDVRLNIKISKLILKTGVRNLFNYNYAPMESNLMPPRTYVIGLQGKI
ncbi:TonB-dependent receptor [bacterium]|nr:TonB-dependent receptor [bacterium]